MPCNYRANGCNVWMSVHAERNLSYAKIIYIIKKSKLGKDVLKYFKTPGSQIAHKHLRCATRRSRPASRLPGWERRAGRLRCLARQRRPRVSGNITAWLSTHYKTACFMLQNRPFCMAKRLILTDKDKAGPPQRRRGGTGIDGLQNLRAPTTAVAAQSTRNAGTIV